MNSTKRRKIWSRVALFCAAVFVACSTMGMFAACGESEEDDSSTTSNPDTQLIKNGDFEYYSDNDGKYMISTPTSWSSASLGTSSYTMSGVVNTAAYKWDKLTSVDSATTLYLNNLLSSYYSDSDLSDKVASDYDDYYEDYNGMSEYDLPFRNVEYAMEILENLNDLEDEDKKFIPDFSDPTNNAVNLDALYDDGTFIDNPGTHDDIQVFGNADDGFYYTDAEGTREDLLYNEDDDKLYREYDAVNDKYSDPLGTSVLMIHNYLKNGNGTGQYFSSSTTVTLEANTAAELSVWVKTSDLYYNGYKPVTQDRGAFIEVVQTVGSETLDSFIIKDINTEKINPDGENNGWVKYTVYIQACDFADTTITLRLGLGDNGAGAVEGYAFFDDVEMTKYSSLDAMEEDLGYELSEKIAVYGDEYDNVEAGTFMTKEDGGTYCSLLSEGNEKIFEADTYYVTSETQSGDDVYDERFSNDFYYYIDLIATGDRVSIGMSPDNLEAGLTVDKDYYTVNGSNPSNIIGATATDIGTEAHDGIDASKEDGYYYLNPSLTGIDTSEDVIANLKITDENTVKDALSFSRYDDLLNDALQSARFLPNADDETDTLIILSTMGAAYTATVTDESFTLEADSYLIVSVWVKTSEMNGKTAATLRLVDADDEDNYIDIAIETTDVTTDIEQNDGSKEEDIYDGWVQCFFYVYNDTEETKTFNLQLMFGNTTIRDTSLTSFSGGWAAFTNIQTLEVTETEYGYAGNGTYTANFTFSVTDNRSGSFFADATSDADIEENITKPVGYEGVNGASTAVTAQNTTTSYDYSDENEYAGLINADYFEDYVNALLENENDPDYAWLKSLLLTYYDYGDLSAITAARSAEEMWRDIFGAYSVQPLLVVNTVRTYAENKTNEELSEVEILAGNYYYSETDEYGNVFYVRITEDNFEEGRDYYTLRQAYNYGYISDDETLTSDTYTAITLKVKVSEGATAYIYLTDTTKDRDVMHYTIPEYTFWYDGDGNVLKEAPSDDDDYDEYANIAYELRSDGLYNLYHEEDAVNSDDQDYQYANLYSLTPSYFNENLMYYDEDGEAVSYDNLEDDVYYYTSPAKTAYVAHRLVNSDGTRIFEYSGVGVGNDAVYYYYYYDQDDEDISSPKIDTSYQVKTFNTEIATPRYTYATLLDGDNVTTGFYYEISDTRGEWVTVSFYVHTGSESKGYSLELWSGTRDSSGMERYAMENEATFSDDGLLVNEDGTVSKTTATGSYVIFDYNYSSLDESSYAALVSEYTDEIIDSYRSLIVQYLGYDALGEIASYDENISYYEQFIADKRDEGALSASEYNSIMNQMDYYKAVYYCFTLYDSAAYYPFNEDMAGEGESGYDYIMDEDESLAYMRYVKYDANGNATDFLMFIDYGLVDQSYEVTVGLTDEDEDEDEESTTNFWLLLTSIILVVALLVTLISMAVREIVKRVRQRKNVKSLSRNTYNKRKRYIHQYTKANGEVASAGEADEDDEE